MASFLRIFYRPPLGRAHHHPLPTLLSWLCVCPEQISFGEFCSGAAGTVDTRSLENPSTRSYRPIWCHDAIDNLVFPDVVYCSTKLCSAVLGWLYPQISSFPYLIYFLIRQWPCSLRKPAFTWKVNILIIIFAHTTQEWHTKQRNCSLFFICFNMCYSLQPLS